MVQCKKVEVVLKKEVKELLSVQEITDTPLYAGV